MIYTQAGQSFESNADWGITGLVGTIGVTIYDGVGSTVAGRVTTGIVETSTGIYTATLTGPVTIGQFTVVWDDGDSYAADELTVTSAETVAVGPVGPGMTLGEILDAVLLDRFESASHRSRALLSVNSRYAHLWGLEDWTFKFATINPTVDGTGIVGSLPDDFGVPVYLWDENGNQLSYLNTDVFINTYLPGLLSFGSPESWTVTDQQIMLGPVPDHNATYTLYYRKRLTQLSSEGDVPDWPAEFRMAIVHSAGAELRAAYDDPGAMTWERLATQDLDVLRREYLAEAVGQPDTWNDDYWAVA